MPAHSNGPTLEWPPITANAEGQTRRVGLEIEFSGIDLAAAAATVQKRFGGTIQPDDAHRFVVEATSVGDFTVELDTSYAHPSERWPDDGSLTDRAEAMARALVGDVMETWMPREIVSPPVPIDRLPEVDSLCRDLRALGAEGTGAGWQYAFSLQLNPEVASLECADVLAVFRAFLLASDWLRAACAKDALRQQLPFAQPFERGYAAAVLAPEYRPDWTRFITDYLNANKTRNRELDMCPLFAHVDQALVQTLLPDPRIKARPTYHYRLPDCRIDDPEWSIIAEWNRWVLVERLAADKAALAERSAMFLASFADSPPEEWIADTDRWLTGNAHG